MAVPMSLSPRPLRLMITVASGPFSSPSRLATSSAPAIAWADSMAGMIPSVRLSSAIASIACASVTGAYVARPAEASHECWGPTPG